MLPQRVPSPTLIRFLTSFEGDYSALRLTAYARFLQTKITQETHAVYTDSLSNPLVVAVLPNEEYKALFPSFYFWSRHILEPDAYVSFLAGLPYKWNKCFKMEIIQEPILPMMQHFATLKNCSLEKEDAETTVILYIALKEDTEPAKPLHPDFYLSILRPDEAHRINSLWAYKSPGSKATLRSYIEHLPSTCVRSVVDDKLASYCLTEHLGSLGILHTEKQHRGRGLARVVVQEQARKLIALFGFAHAFVLENNLASRRVFEGLGWKDSGMRYRWADWFNGQSH